MNLFNKIRYHLSQIFILECIYVFIVIWKTEDFAASIKAVQRRIKARRMSIVPAKDYDTLNNIIEKNSHKPIVIFHPFIEWNIPLYQRPQHIAINLALNNFLYFYCTNNNQYDNILGFVPGSEGLYHTNRYNMLSELDKKKVVHLCSTDNSTDAEFIEQQLNNGDLILYEYIDAIDAGLDGIPLPERTIIKHKKILNDERCIVIATADKLYKEVLGYRTRNCALVTNGVEYEHFSRKFSRQEAPEEIRELLESDNPIIGYFGALASWFDYELVIRIAQLRPDFQILLIGWDYDKSLGRYGLQDFPNITVCGPIEYKDLPRYASWFDVATIPFKINEITESTSPIKLFEYMALGHPIVTTGMPECRKYKSVLIGETHDDFIAKLELALKLREDQAYCNLLKQEALENTWAAKAAAIAELVRANLDSQTAGVQTD